MAKFFGALIGNIVSGVIGKLISLAVVFAVAGYFTGGKSVELAKGAFGFASAGLAGEKLRIFDGEASGAAEQPSAFRLQARIASVRGFCRLVLPGDGVDKRTQSTSCAQAERMLLMPSFKSYELREYVGVEYLYYSPDGVTVLTGRAETPVRGERVFKVGGVLDIEIESDDPGRSRIL